MQLKTFAKTILTSVQENSISVILMKAIIRTSFHQCCSINLLYRELAVVNGE